MKAVYIAHSLTDQDVANFARQSFGKKAEEYTDEQNNNLVRYLARGMTTKDWEELRNSELPRMYAEDDQERQDFLTFMRSIPEHWVPFGHPTISIRMQAPVPIARQLFKHKIGFVESEESRRYISGTPELYIPEAFRAGAQNVKQGSAGQHPNSDHWLRMYTDYCNSQITLYETMIKDGICPEQARFILPQGVEVNWVWTGSLYAFSQMCVKRLDSHAQKETQILAQEIDAIIAPLFPVSWNALVHGKY
jgi:thymidylate synthase (FAD)